LIHKEVGLQNYTISKQELKKIFSALNIRNHSEAYFIADPIGKIILYYPSNVNGEDIYQDLLRLLTISTTTG
jgi:cytochrome oxidase Cu insertion factor (SCO1/SenC/PrrC family)